MGKCNTYGIYIEADLYCFVQTKAGAKASIRSLQKKYPGHYVYMKQVNR